VSILKLVPVASLPTPRAGFIDCRALGCETNAVCLNTFCDERLYLSCIACRAFLICDLRYGWTIKEASREEIARKREEAREDNAPRVGAVWAELKRMRRAA
jgi:hypothetical protein